MPISSALGLALAIVALLAPTHPDLHRTSASDSVTVLLLSRPPAREATIDDGDERTTIAARGDSIAVVGIPTLRDTMTFDGAMTITSGKRSRSVRALVAVWSREDALVIVARMKIADYLAGTLASESSARDPRSYLVALSALQRNYVAQHRNRHAPLADLCDNTHCQLHHGASVTPRVRNVVDDALAIEITADGALPCYYSANCGGSSLTPASVWHRVERGYTSVRCTECRNSRWYRWTSRVDANARARAVMRTAPATPFVDDDFKIRAGRELGFDAVPSNTIDRIERRGGHFRISGRGFGHRVGLCQDGAREMARRGRNAVEILRRYFPDATVTQQR
jgi:stage II sporulation protein D